MPNNETSLEQALAYEELVQKHGAGIPKEHKMHYGNIEVICGEVVNNPESFVGGKGLTKRQWFEKIVDEELKGLKGQMLEDWDKHHGEETKSTTD